jgi:hypothetical protein
VILLELVTNHVFMLATKLYMYISVHY